LVQNYEFVELSLNSNKTPDQMGSLSKSLGAMLQLY